ncbi:alpha/beta fold hydrolase [Streptomyces sp. NPDC002520]
MTIPHPLSPARVTAEAANLILTADEANIAATPRDVVWTHRTTTLYRYRSDRRRHPVPVLLVFALINRPDVFDLRPGNSFVEFLLGEGFDVYLLDWGVPDEEDADRGLETYVCDQLHWAVRRVLRSSGSDRVSLAGWCMGAAFTAMYAALHPGGPVANTVLLTMPFDTEGSVYRRWVTADTYDVDALADLRVVPGHAIDWANKMLKPVGNYVTTYRRLWDQVEQGTVDREAFQSMARWVADNPPFPARAYREWISWLYQDNRFASGTLRLRGRRVDPARIDAAVLVVTAAGDHIAPREGTLPFLDRVGSADVTHFDRPGGHIGLMAGSKARDRIWPDIAGWLAARSAPSPTRSTP